MEESLWAEAWKARWSGKAASTPRSVTVGVDWAAEEVGDRR
jgi:hypothetical protein